MPSAFISYAHEDQEFVLALVEHLQAHEGLDVRYDRVVLHIGDSLIRAISQEITDGDFLIAVISPDSVASEWCQHELAIAQAQAIDEKRVKVLPIRYRGAEMPPMFADAYWGDADRLDVETLSGEVTAAIRAQVEGREPEAPGDAGQARHGAPPHAEVPGDVVVAQFDEAANKVWDVFAEWARVSGGQANIRELEDQQRRLRWALDLLPDRVRPGLPLVSQLADADWDAYFGVAQLPEAEWNIREEMRSVRTQVAQGLAVTHRWTIGRDLGEVSAGGRDAVAYLWELVRGDEFREVEVYISGTALWASNESLPREVAQAKETAGRSVVASLLALDDPPTQLSVSTAGISLSLPD